MRALLAKRVAFAVALTALLVYGTGGPEGWHTALLGVAGGLIANLIPDRKRP